jgi:hypothetical protein
MRSKYILPYSKFAIQALVQHKKYGVSPEYMEIVLRIQYHRVKDHWTKERYEAELMALAIRFPNEVVKHMEFFEERDVQKYRGTRKNH